MTRLTGLDGLRGVAALVVLIYHVQIEFFGYHSEGFLAVDFFFVLSGYVMARIISGQTRTVPLFFFARFRRFWPTMMVGTALGLALLDIPLSLQTVLLSALLLPNLSAATFFPLNPPAWSIFYELVVSSVQPVLTPLVTLVGFVTSTIVLVLAVYEVGDYGFGASYLAYGFARVIMAYTLGGLLFHSWQDRPPVKVSLPIACAVFISLLLTNLPPALDFMFVLLVSPLLIAAGLSSSPSWGGKLGELSFPLYAFHAPILLWAPHWTLALILPIGLAIVWTQLPAFSWRMPHRIWS